MSTKIEIAESNGNLAADIYVNNNWFKQIILEYDADKTTISEVLNCVAHSLENDEDYNINQG